MDEHKFKVDEIVLDIITGKKAEVLELLITSPVNPKTFGDMLINCYGYKILTVFEKQNPLRSILWRDEEQLVEITEIGKLLYE